MKRIILSIFIVSLIFISNCGDSKSFNIGGLYPGLDTKVAIKKAENLYKDLNLEPKIEQGRDYVSITDSVTSAEINLWLSGDRKVVKLIEMPKELWEMVYNVRQMPPKEFVKMLNDKYKLNLEHKTKDWGEGIKTHFWIHETDQWYIKIKDLPGGDTDGFVAFSLK